MPATSLYAVMPGLVPGIKPSFVMAGLVPAIHVFELARPLDVDARDKRGHDGGETVYEENQEARRETLICHGRGQSPPSSWPGLSRPSTSLPVLGSRRRRGCHRKSGLPDFRI